MLQIQQPLCRVPVSNAAIVSSAPSSILPSAFVVPSIPLDAIARSVIVQTIIVSINVPHIFIKPCFTWWSDVALAAEIAALPSPASLKIHLLQYRNALNHHTCSKLYPQVRRQQALRRCMKKYLQFRQEHFCNLCKLLQFRQLYKILPLQVQEHLIPLKLI